MKLSKIKSGGEAFHRWWLTIMSSGQDMSDEEKINFLTKYFKYRGTKKLIKSAYKKDSPFLLDLLKLKCQTEEKIRERGNSKLYQMGDRLVDNFELIVCPTILGFLCPILTTVTVNTFLYIPAIILNALTTATLAMMVGIGVNYEHQNNEIDDLYKLNQLARDVMYYY